MRGGMRSTFPSQPGAPTEVSMEPTAANLEWAPPTHSGGSAIVGYRVDVRTAGHGDFSVLIANTNDSEPRVRADGLEPMTWYEFKVAAINGPLGSKWQECTGNRPPTGTELKNAALSAALQQPKLEYTQGELAAYGVQGLRPNCFVMAGGRYYHPADVHCTGPPGGASEPMLTRATVAQERDVEGKSVGRRRRTQQTFGGSLLHAERTALAATAAREAEIAAEVERSLASMASWEEVFRVRHGRVAHDDDRHESRVLRDEAHALRVLRHAHADASLAALEAEGRLAAKEQAVARAAIAKWERQREVVLGDAVSDNDRRADVRYKHLASRLEDAAERERRVDRRRERVLSQLEKARAELHAAAQDPMASAEMVEAAEHADRADEMRHALDAPEAPHRPWQASGPEERTPAVAAGSPPRMGIGGREATTAKGTAAAAASLAKRAPLTPGCGCLGVASAASSASAALPAREGAPSGGGGGGAVRRRWTSELRGNVQARGQQYVELVLSRAVSRDCVDAVSGLSQAAVRRAAVLFGNADRDGDGCLDLAEFRRHLRERFGERHSSDVVFDALARKTDLDDNHLIDFNEWLLFNERRATEPPADASAAAAADAVVAARSLGGEWHDAEAYGTSYGRAALLDGTPPHTPLPEPIAFRLPPMPTEGQWTPAPLDAPLPPAASAAASRVLAVVRPAEEELEERAAAAVGRPPVPLEYLHELLTRSASRTQADEPHGYSGGARGGRARGGGGLRGARGGRAQRAAHARPV